MRGGDRLRPQPGAGEATRHDGERAQELSSPSRPIASPELTFVVRPLSDVATFLPGKRDRASVLTLKARFFVGNRHPTEVAVVLSAFADGILADGRLAHHHRTAGLILGRTGESDLSGPPLTVPPRGHLEVTCSFALGPPPVSPDADGSVWEIPASVTADVGFVDQFGTEYQAGRVTWPRVAHVTS